VSLSPARIVDVVVGLISDGAGRWLVNCRPVGTPLAGSWEFPGGKVHAGEPRFVALKRELDEELGIDVLEAEPLLELTHDYPDKRVRLDVWRVLRYRGDAVGREGQSLRWTTVDGLRDLPLLEADCPIVERLVQIGLPTRN
jgi:8-oxo-dGTP diphosphatase